LFRKGAGAAYNLGFHTHSVPMALYELNRKCLLLRLKQRKVDEKAVVLLEGGKSSDFQRYSSDVCHTPFRQVCEVSAENGVMLMFAERRFVITVNQLRLPHRIKTGKISDEQKTKKMNS